MNYLDRTEDIERLLPRKDTRSSFNDTALFKLKEASRIPFIYSMSFFEAGAPAEYEIRAVLKEGAKPAGCSKTELDQTASYSDAYNFLFKLVKKEKIAETDIIELHEMMYKNTDEQSAGKYRRKNLVFAETSYQPPDFKQIPGLIADFTALMPEMQKILAPVKFAAWIHLNFLNIFPFDCGNFACAFILSNFAVLQAGYPLIIVPPVLKQDYYDVLKQAQKEKEPYAFSAFISEQTYEAVRDYIRAEGNFIK